MAHMSESIKALESGVPGAISDEALKKAEAYIEEEEGAANRMTGRMAGFLTLVAVIMSLFHLYSAYAIVPTQTLRPVHVGFVLFLSFLIFPVAGAFATASCGGTGWPRCCRWRSLSMS